MKALLFLIFTILNLPIAFTQVGAPGGISSNNTIWIKANEGVTVNAPNIVAQMQNFANLNIGGNFSTQPAAINKPTHTPPTILENGINFNPYIIFQSANSNSISSNTAYDGLSLMGANEVSVYKVMLLNANASTGVWLKWQWNTNPYSGPRLGNEINPGSNPGQVRFDYRSPNIYSATNVQDKHILITQECDASVKSIRLQSQTDISVTPTGTFSPGTTTGRLTLGAEPYGDNYPCNVQIAEVIIYKTKLNANDRRKVESYLGVKYGFTLQQTGPDATNYVSANNTVIWDQVGNAAYPYNITGIGRDDLSALQQKQSRSINTNGLVTIYHGNTNGIFPGTNNSNTASFSSNNNFVLFGDNELSLLPSICADNNSSIRMARVWKTQLTGAPMEVTLTIPNSGVNPDIKNLLVSTDPTFNTNVTSIPLQSGSGMKYASTIIQANMYFTFSTQPLIVSATIDTICYGGSGDIQLNISGGLNPLTFNWNSTPNQYTRDLLNVKGGKYSVTINQNGMCPTVHSFEIFEVKEKTSFIADNFEPAICTSKNGSVRITPLGNGYPYMFSTNGIDFDYSSFITGLGKGNHVITIKDNLGCLYDTTIFIDNIDIPIAFSCMVGDAYCNAGGLAGYIKVNATNGYYPVKYAFNDLNYEQSNELKNIGKGDYKIVVTDGMGCKGDTLISLIEIPCCKVWFPNAFSPNDDGINDKFGPVVNIPFRRYQLIIYNRWGQRVFSSGDHNQAWYGRDERNGLHAEVGVYYYNVKYTCTMSNEEITEHGEVNLIR